MRVSGTAVSLIGIEQALDQNCPELLVQSCRLLLMIYSVLCSVSGIPLLFMGEEQAALNDYDFEQDPEKAEDSRWVHRLQMSWPDTANADKKLTQNQVDKNQVDQPQKQTQAQKKSLPSPSKKVFQNLQKIIALRKQTAAFRGNQIEVLELENPHVLAFARWHQGNQVIVIANFSEHELELELTHLRSKWLTPFMQDLLKKREVQTSTSLRASLRTSHGLQLALFSSGFVDDNPRYLKDGVKKSLPCQRKKLLR